MPNKFQIMSEGGSRLGKIKYEVSQFVKDGVTPLEVDSLVERLIRAGGDRPSFQMVRGYKHSTCINVNSGMVHGIPNSIPFKKGDVVKDDMGLFHDGYHLDSAITIQIPPRTSEIDKFLKSSQVALASAIFVATPGNTVYDIGHAMQTTTEAAGYNVVRDLTGHGIGKQLHMEPFIPCFADSKNKKYVLSVGQTVAIEAMITMGDWHLVEESDGWTLSTQDGSVTAMFEETVYISEDGPIILTGIHE